MRLSGQFVQLHKIRQLDITPRSIKKTNNFSFKYFYIHNKVHKQLSFGYYV